MICGGMTKTINICQDINHVFIKLYHVHQYTSYPVHDEEILK